MPKFAKTRLIPAVGEEAAAEISKQLTELALKTIREHTKSHSSTVTMIHYYAPQDLPLEAMQAWLRPTINETLRQQSPGDLGDRLISSFKSSFAEGAAKVIVIGSDCPGITADLLTDAFKALDRADVVIGPAVDGGYYLLGMKRLHESLFSQIPWSTSSVHERTCAAAERERLSLISLQTLRDIDTEEDLPYFYQLLSENS